MLTSKEETQGDNLTQTQFKSKYIQYLLIIPCWVAPNQNTKRKKQILYEHPVYLFQMHSDTNIEK